jgi:hypothetical protein
MYLSNAAKVAQTIRNTHSENKPNMQKQLSIFFIFFLVYPLSLAQAQQTFETPQIAAQSLINAAKTDDPTRVDTILGKDARAVISSGDPVYDRQIKAALVTAYDKAHDIVHTDDANIVILKVGPGDWPFAIPIVKGENGWYFDVAEGKRKMLFRRTSFNEINAILICLTYTDVQSEYAEMSRKRTGIDAYAQHIISHPGKKDGLYWPHKSKEEKSPLGDFMARATIEGYRNNGEKSPYHGYYYKILTRQGPSAKGGQFNYVTDGHMIGGFALVAWPAKYRNSGVMTFIVSHDGTIYQRDLGEETPKIVANMKEFNPDKRWESVALFKTYWPE